MRNDVPFKSLGVCGVAPQRGDLLVGNLNLDPGRPKNSVMWLRMSVRTTIGWLSGSEIFGC